MDAVESRAIVIEPARSADAHAVIDLIGRVFAEYDFIWDPATEVPDLFDLEHRYGGDAGAFWVARLDGRVVGSVGVERLDDGRAELHRLYLDASLRGRGVGRALVEAVLGWCRAAVKHQTPGHHAAVSKPIPLTKPQPPAKSAKPAEPVLPRV